MYRELPKSSDEQAGLLRISAIQKALGLVCLAPPREDFVAATGFASDVLSEVLAHAPQGSVLVTAQCNMNVVAVAALVEIGGVIVTSGHSPDIEVVARAREERVGLYSTPRETFDVVAGLSLLGLKGQDEAGRRRGGRKETGEAPKG